MPATQLQERIAITGLGTALAPETQSLEELALRGLLVSTPETLQSLGFDHIHIAGLSADAGFELARQAASSALLDAAIDPLDIDVLLWASALPESHHQPGLHPQSHLARFNSSASRLQELLGLDHATVQGVAQQGCGGLFAALRTARALLIAEPALNHVLCVGADILQADCPREMLYNVISDAAAAVVVSRDGCRGLRWIDFHSVTKGYYWDVPARQKEILAAYFPTSRLIINELLYRNNLKGNDITHLIPTGVGSGSWPILANLCGIPVDRLRNSAGSFGHTIAADNIIHLEALNKSGGIHPGDRLLLFTYGFGSTWCGLLLEKTRL